MIKQSMPLVEKKDFKYIRDIVNTGQVAGGAFVGELERSFNDIVGSKYSIAVSNGTAALHLALMALGIGEGDEVIIPSYTCTALLNAVNYVRSKPVLVDIDRETFNINSDTIRKRISKKTKAIIITHTFGFPADSDGILELGIPVIEDCAHSLGSLYRKKLTGRAGKVSIFSMYPTKMAACGEGGMVCTSDDRLAGRIRNLNNPDSRDDYRVRYNYKMSDLTAGLAVSQLKKLDFFVSRRVSIAKRYKDNFSPLPVIFQKSLPDTRPNYYRFVICTPRLEEIIGFMQKRKVMCDRPVYKPLHRYLNPGKNGEFPGSEFVWENAVSVPIYPALKDRQITKIIDTTMRAFKSLE